jgi:hypothetical protein
MSEQLDRHYFRWVKPSWWILILGGLGLTAYFAFRPGPESIPWFDENLGTAAVLFRKSVCTWIFYLGWGAHVIEASIGTLTAYRMGLKSWPMWGFQTFMLGGPSLKLLFAYQNRLFKQGKYQKKRN